MTVNKKIQYKQNLSLLFACVALLVYGGCALYENGGINFVSLVASSKTVVPAVFIMYVLGWLTGAVLESSKLVKKAKDIGYTNSLLEEILKEEGLDGTDESDLLNIDSETEEPKNESNE